MGWAIYGPTSNSGRAFPEGVSEAGVTSHAAWDVDAVHGVHAMHSVTKVGTAQGGRSVRRLRGRRLRVAAGEVRALRSATWGAVCTRIGRVLKID